jgi:hypothetical protein
MRFDVRLTMSRTETLYCGDQPLDFGIDFYLFGLLLFLLHLNHVHLHGLSEQGLDFGFLCRRQICRGRADRR